MLKIPIALPKWLRFESHSQQVQRLGREEIARLFDPCPLCSHRVSHHTYFDLCFAAVGGPEEAAAMECTKKHDWQKLRGFREADMQADHKVWRILKCPSGGAVLGIVISHYEYSLHDVLAESLNLTPEDISEIEEIAHGAWVEL